MRVRRCMFLVPVVALSACSTMYYGSHGEAGGAPRAVAGFSDKLVSVEANVETLVRDMEAAIAEADAFVASLQEG